MKLLIANYSLAGLGGSQLHTLDLCRGFRRAGHDVVAFSVRPGPVADILTRDNIAVRSPSDLGDLGKHPFDIVYLHHASCEILLGLAFARRVPIIRGYLGTVPLQEKPVSGNFASAAVYKSEYDRLTLGCRADIPSLIAYNVYDDRCVVSGGAPREHPPAKPAFAVVTNHLDPGLAAVLDKAAQEDLCSYTHFGKPGNSVPVTPELLRPFDAVITIGRTVVLAAALDKPVYVCDVHGSDGWLTRGSFEGSRYAAFTGRVIANKDWSVIRRQLLEQHGWPGPDDLIWLRERVALDHSLSRRVEQLEGFFADVIAKAPRAATSPAGDQAVLQYIIGLSGTESANTRLRAKLQRSNARARRHEGRALRLKAQAGRWKVRAQRAERQLRELQNQNTWERLRALVRCLRQAGKSGGVRPRENS